MLGSPDGDLRTTSGPHRAVIVHRAITVAVVLLLAGVQPATAVTAGGADAGSWTTAYDAEPAVDPGGETTVTATVTNDGQVPGNATIPFTRNGETVTTRTVALGPGERETVSATVELPAAGEYRVGAGGRAVGVRAVAPTSETTGPGFGIPVAIVAVLAALGVRQRRSGG